MPKGKKIVKAEDFIQFWQKAETPDDVATKFGITRASALQKASNYRRNGVSKLKEFPRGPKKLDYAALNALAADSLKTAAPAKKSGKRA